MSDPLIMSFFLAVPIASLLWAVVCFGVTIVAYCVQGTNARSSILLVVTFGLATSAGALAMMSYKLRYVWRAPPSEERD